MLPGPSLLGHQTCQRNGATASFVKPFQILGESLGRTTCTKLRTVDVKTCKLQWIHTEDKRTYAFFWKFGIWETCFLFGLRRIEQLTLHSCYLLVADIFIALEGIGPIGGGSVACCLICTVIALIRTGQTTSIEQRDPLETTTITTSDCWSAWPKKLTVHFSDSWNCVLPWFTI